MSARLRALMAFITVAALSRTAFGDDLARARQLFTDGIRLYQSGDWEGALRAFRSANAEHHAPAIVYNVGLAEEKLGHAQAAVDNYEVYVAESGDKGEYLASAVAAIARIKSRSTRLRLESRPPGARIFLDGSPLDERAPTSVLVRAGHHVVVAEGDGWRGERVIETRGEADSLSVVLDAPEPPALEPIPPPPAPTTTPTTAPTTASTSASPWADRPASGAAPPEASPGPESFTWGAEFAVMPTYFLAASDATAANGRPALSLFAGPILEVGYALTARFEFLLRGLAGVGQVGIGRSGTPSTVYMGGPGFSYRAISFLWTGASFFGGRADTAAHGAPYGTDLVFGGMVEANVVMLRQAHGEWLLGVQPSVLWANTVLDNFGFFFPASFGYRAY